eukprot:m.7445 g.7445  ORF g.7445 m.7445 type:complete len:65 (+) comp5916_c0_seq1:291-485(+)
MCLPCYTHTQVCHATYTSTYKQTVYTHAYKCRIGCNDSTVIVVFVCLCVFLCTLPTCFLTNRLR